MLPQWDDFLDDFVELATFYTPPTSTTSTTSSLPEQPTAVEEQGVMVNAGENGEIGDFVPVAGPEHWPR